jgi:RND family efflux transporter MFP subunit
MLSVNKSGTLLFIAAAGLIIFMLSLTGCNSPGGRPSGRDRAESPPVPVITERVELRDLQEFLTITGKLEGITDIVLMSETNGRIIKLHKTLGNRVEIGDEIAEIDNEVYKIRLAQAEATLASTQAAYDAATLSFRSAETLYDKGSISQADYKQTLFSYQGSKAQYQGAEAALNSAQKAYDSSRLISPVSGYITALHLKVGETLFPNTPVAVIVNHDQLLLKTGLSENNVKSVRKGQTAVIRRNDKEYKGIITGVGINQNPNSSTYPVEITLNNKEHELYPGMIVSANILTTLNKETIYLETANIRTRYDEHFIYIVDDENRAQQRGIVPARTFNEFTVVSSGLEVGDKLIVSGMDSLEEGMAVNVRN